MNYKILDNVDVTYINHVLWKNGEIQPVSASVLKDIPQEHLMLWCVQNAIYQIPTLELIEWLRQKIGNRSAIEIGSGKSGIGKALGIRCTDSYMQTTPEIVAYYNLLKQTPIYPPAYVEKLAANEAVNKYKPEVVIGSFITHRHRTGQAEGNMYGPEEEFIVDRAEYIHIGNRITHKSKPILNLQHEEFQFPWLVSRAIEQSQNAIWVWNFTASKS